MDLIAYLRVFRRRWALLALPAVGALLVAWVTLPEQQQAGPVVRTYTSTATLIATPNYQATTQVPLDLATVALFATVGEVPERAAKNIGYDGEPQVLASQVVVTSVPETSTLTITSTDGDAESVTKRVNAFAAATVGYFRDKEQAEARSRVRALNRQLEHTTNELRDVQQEMRQTPKDPILQARLQAMQTQYSTQFGEISMLNQQLGGAGPIDVLQPGVPIPQTSGGFVAPTSPWARLGLAGLLGLILGAALALVVERLDSRLRTREQVEDAFGLPVLAEIPALPVQQRKLQGVLSAERPASPTAEAYRALRSSVLLLRPDGLQSAVDAPAEATSLVVMVTSALPGEGKTTTVANLAAVMAEAGRRVLVLSLDLRCPRIHEYLDVSDGAGISDLLAADRVQHLEQVVRDSGVPGVRVATSGQELGHPGALLASAGPLLDAARSIADVVLVDTAPILAVTDAVDLAQHVDIAVVVSRLNKTTNSQAAAAHRILSRLGVPALGTVLIGSRPTGAQDSYLLRMPPRRDYQSPDADQRPPTVTTLTAVQPTEGTQEGNS